MPELIRIEVPEPITIQAQQPDGSTQPLKYTFENYVMYLLNTCKAFNADGVGMRSSLSIIDALKAMNDVAKLEEDEDTEPPEADGEKADEPEEDAEEPEPDEQEASEEGQTEAIEKVEEKAPLLFIIDQVDWERLRGCSEAPDRGYPFADLGLAARNFAPFANVIKFAGDDLKEKAKPISKGKGKRRK